MDEEIDFSVSNEVSKKPVGHIYDLFYALALAKLNYLYLQVQAILTLCNILLLFLL